MIFDIKVFRITHHLTQQKMAELLGLTKSAVSMIEAGKRQLSEEARIKFYEIQQQEAGDSQPDHAIKPEPFYNQLKAEHQAYSEEYIHFYIGDLQSEKHRLEKKIKAWTEKFHKAGVVLRKTEAILLSVQTEKLNYEAAMEDLVNDKQIAEKQLRDVIREKPALAIIRIEGIKKELAVAKDLLSKRQRFPMIDSVITYTKGMREVKKIDFAALTLKDSPKE